MILKLILYIVLFLFGSAGIMLGSMGIVNKRFIGYLVATAGLSVAIFSGFGIYDFVLRANVSDAVLEITNQLSDAQKKLSDDLKLRADWIKQRDEQFKSLSAMGISTEQFEAALYDNKEVMLIVEKISLLNRWVALSDTQIAADTEVISNCKNMLFYLENKEKVGAAGFDPNFAIPSGLDLDNAIEGAKALPGDSKAIEISPIEIQEVMDMYKSLQK